MANKGRYLHNSTIKYRRLLYLRRSNQETVRALTCVGSSWRRRENGWMVRQDCRKGAVWATTQRKERPVNSHRLRLRSSSASMQPISTHLNMRLSSSAYRSYLENGSMEQENDLYNLWSWLWFLIYQNHLQKSHPNYSVTFENGAWSHFALVIDYSKL